jgi:hypothetical protein
MSGDRNNLICAPRRRRRAAGTVCLAAGLSLAAIGVAFTSLPAHGESATAAPAPATQPAADAQAQPAAQRSRAADPVRPGPRMRDERPTPAPAADIPWDEIAAFMRQHSPLKWERWEQFNHKYPAGYGRGDLKQRLEDGIRGQYAELKKVKGVDPVEYELDVRRVEIEDKIFGANADYRRGTDDVEKQSRARTQMQQHVRDMLALRDELKKHRLERRKAELAHQSEQIDKQLAALAEKSSPQEKQIANIARNLLSDQPPPLWDRSGSGPANPPSGSPRRDGGAPDDREQRPGPAAPTTKPTAGEESPRGDK